MTKGRLIAVVGPSGVGKDSVMAGLHAARPDMVLVKRVITRAPELGGEDYDAVSVGDFNQMVRQGAFAVHWGAHDLLYGIPASVHGQLDQGKTCLANFSRSALLQAAGVFEDFVVFNVTASPETLAQRLRERGRESKAQIEKRLAQAVKPLPSGLKAVEVSNDGALSCTIAQALNLLYPESA